MGIKARIRNGQGSADESDIQHLDSDFVAAGGVLDLVTDCIVTQNTGSDRNVLISTGVVYVRNSAYAKAQGYTRYVSGEIDAQVTLAIDPNTTLATRIDIVCVKYDSAVSPNSDASNSVVSIVDVKGTSNGVAPTIPADHIPLARLSLAQSFTGITNANITDMRQQVGLDIRDGWTPIDKSEDPLAVTGTLAIVQYVSATSLKIYDPEQKFYNQLSKFDKLKLRQTINKYFFITADPTWSANYLTCTISGGETYTLANAAISNVYFSKYEFPFGMPEAVLTYRQTASNNKLINGNFDHWSSGTSFTPNDDTYGPDMWNFLVETNGSWTFSRSNDVPSTKSAFSLKAENVSANNQCAIVQFIENIEAVKLANKRASISFAAKTTGTEISNLRCTLLSWNSTADTITSDVISAWAQNGTDPTWVTNWTAEVAGSNLALTSSWQTFKIEDINIDTSSMTNLALVIWVDDGTITSGDEFYVTQAELAPGSIAPIYQPKDSILERNECRRFRKVITTSVNSEIVALGSASSTSGGSLIIQLEGPMRVKPSITVTAANWTVTDGVTSTALTGLTMSPIGGNTAIVLSFTVSGTPLTQYRPYFMIAPTAPQSIILSAEL